LLNGRHYLVEKYAISVGLKAKQTYQHNEVNALGVSQGHDLFSPIPCVIEEFQSIVIQDDQDSGILHGTIHLDADFTTETMVEALESESPILHIASHFVFSPFHIADSKLLLGDESTLSLQDLVESDLDLSHKSLIVLSACQTAMGTQVNQRNGAEFDGLAGAFFQMGASSVLASLWPVADQSTVIFMQEFYAALAKYENKSVALQQAQLALIQLSENKKSKQTRGLQFPSQESQPNTNWNHPYYWAPFLFIGSP